MVKSDPYLTSEACTSRLMREWRKYSGLFDSGLIVACDFDDTVFDFHNTGAIYPRVIETLIECKKLGFYVVVFTASHPSRYEYMREYFRERGIEVDAINENPIPLPFGNHGKIYYNILLDDRAGLGQALETLNQVITLVRFEKET